MPGGMKWHFELISLHDAPQFCYEQVAQYVFHSEPSSFPFPTIAPATSPYFLREHIQELHTDYSHSQIGKRNKNLVLLLILIFNLIFKSNLFQQTINE